MAMQELGFSAMEESLTSHLTALIDAQQATAAEVRKVQKGVAEFQLSLQKRKGELTKAIAEKLDEALKKQTADITKAVTAGLTEVLGAAVREQLAPLRAFLACAHNATGPGCTLAPVPVTEGHTIGTVPENLPKKVFGRKRLRPNEACAALPACGVLTDVNNKPRKKPTSVCGVPRADSGEK